MSWYAPKKGPKGPIVSSIPLERLASVSRHLQADKVGLKHALFDLCPANYLLLQAVPHPRDIKYVPEYKEYDAKRPVKVR